MKIQNMIKTFAVRKYRKALSITLASLLLASSFPVNGGTALAIDVTAHVAILIEAPKHLGDEENSLPGEYIRDRFERDFDLPGIINVGSAHFLALQTYGVDTDCNRFEINGVQISGALRKRSSPEFVTEIARIPKNLLKPTGNTLRIISLNTGCSVGGNLDDFGIANVFVLYR